MYFKFNLVFKMNFFFPPEKEKYICRKKYLIFEIRSKAENVSYVTSHRFVFNLHEFISL